MLNMSCGMGASAALTTALTTLAHLLSAHKKVTLTGPGGTRDPQSKLIRRLGGMMEE